jgi:hypothetical protein
LASFFNPMFKVLYLILSKLNSIQIERSVNSCVPVL